MVAGAGTALLAAVLYLLSWGSLVTESIEGAQAAQGAGGLTPSAGMAMLGFVGASLFGGMIFGLVGGLFGERLAGPLRHKPATTWAFRMAVVAAISVTPLLLLGGLVTSTGSGLAVPDWPGTYGANMFLYPIALMADPRIFLEHGVSTIASALFVWATPSLRKKLDVPASLVAVVVVGVALVVGLRLHMAETLDGMTFGGFGLLVAVASITWYLTALA